MPAHPRGLAPDRNARRNARRNEAEYPSASASGHFAPPTGPSRGALPQHASAVAQPVSAVPSTNGSAAASIPEPPPSIPTFAHVPYFTSIQLELLYARRRGSKMSASSWLTNRDIATGFIQAVASRLGFPQRTIATAQQIYQRFHLFYSPAEFQLHEVAVACLFVAAKLNDTLKKPRDILLASYALRFPQLVKGASSVIDHTGPSTTLTAQEPSFPTLAGQKRKHASIPTVDTSSPRPLAMPIGSVGESDIDPNILEHDRKRLMQSEKLILESLCFNFHSNANIALKMVIKLGRRSGLSKSFIRTAWKLTADIFRTTAPMQYLPNVIAVAALYAAALLARPPTSTTVVSEQQDVPTSEAETKEDDALKSFLESIKTVSASPTPTDATKAAGCSRIPLSEPFPGCDPECHVYVEDVEEAIHELLDLYLACAAQLPPSLYMTSASGLGSTYGPAGSAAATPSPLSPADPHDAIGASPSSSAGLSDPSAPPTTARRKLKQYEYSPPPFGLVDWLNSARCAQLQLQLPEKTVAANNGTRTQPVASSTDPTAPTKELSALLTDLKIYLRGLEYDRQRADDAYLAERAIMAEVNVVPLPGVGAEEAAMQGLGMMPPAHSVGISFKSLSEVQMGQGDSRRANADPMAGLDQTQREVMERIRRRKLVSALKVTFIEPEVEKRPTPAIASEARNLVKSEPPSAEVAVPLAKRNRIEAAKRYLF